MPDHVVVLVTARDEQEARRISLAVVEEGLAGCSTLLGGVTSVFRWKGRVEEAGEVLLMIKTRHAIFERLARRVSELHSYETPEIIALPMVAGSKDYLAWLDEVVTP